MVHRNLLGISAVMLSSAVLIHSLKSADASMPVGMQHGQFPYVSFSHHDGTIPYVNNSTQNVLTVPSDRIFIVTGMVDSSNSCNLYVDGSIIRGGNSIFYETNMFTTGNAHLVIPAGSTLQIHSNGYCLVRHLEGYYAHL